MARKKDRKLPKDPRRRQQVKTFLERYGRDGYRLVGSRDGKPTAGSFDSERARMAGIRSGEARRAKRAAEDKKIELEKKRNARQ